MISRKELEEIARLKSLNLGNAEKDYLLDIALLSISRNTKSELIFKGGTCLYKFYKLNRFSEDLDFSAVTYIHVDKLITKLISDFKKFGINALFHKKKEPYNSVLVTLRLEGPLFSGKPITYAKLGIDINMKSLSILEPEIRSYSPVYQEIPAINVLCMKVEEIFSEKIRAILTRKRARDLFDLHFLIEKGVYADNNLINKKMAYYNEVFNLNKLILRIKNLEPYWKKELVGFTNSLSNFKDVRERTIGKLRGLYT